MSTGRHARARQDSKPRLSYRASAASMIIAVGFTSAMTLIGGAAAVVPAQAASARQRALRTFSVGSKPTLTTVSARRRTPRTYVIRAGDTLASVAQRVYRSRDWQALWWINRSTVGNPDRISAGQRLRLSWWHPAAVPSWLRKAADAAVPQPVTTTTLTAHITSVASGPAFGVPEGPGRWLFSFAALEKLWVWAGGPAAYEWDMATIAECESGGQSWAYNGSGASGIWQILGTPWPGDPMNPWTNARMAVTKFDDAKGMSPWVCQA